MSGADPVGEFIVGNAVLNKPTELLLKPIIKSVTPFVNKSIGAFNKVKVNYRDMNNLNKFADVYTYKRPSANIFNSKSVDNAYKTLLNQHNTFVRGVSINEKTLSNPKVLEELKRANIYNPEVDKVIPKERIGEYMATHIPNDTGYGRAGINEGESGLYTSNSLDTAKGYVYGNGYIATVRRPVDYTSPYRQE